MGFENISLGVREENEQDSSGCRCLLVVGICTTS